MRGSVRHCRFRTVVIALAMLAAMTVARPVPAGRIDDVTHTVHNLSVTGPGPVVATSETRVCVFCHTPHAAEKIPAAPLWNRKLSGATYVPYSSGSMKAVVGQPGGSSRLCLSCHDGTLALGTVHVLNARENVTIGLTGTGAGGTMPTGAGAQTGYTRNLGTNLTNDHPISFTYDSTLAAADGGLYNPALTSYIVNRAPGVYPLVPLENNQVQCVSCHDPHLRDTDASKDIKFLRLHRFQHSAPVGGSFNAASDILCLACHDMGQAWAASAHATPAVADEIYTPVAAALRQFPADTQVWQAACLNCHDPHTVQGARHLLRAGTNSTLTPKSGGTSALEQTCYQCHSADGGVLQGQGTTGFAVPDIKSAFALPRHMPITDAEQLAGREVHTITDADLMETPLLLGKGNLNNRHVECTDCHNPHRMIKNQLFNGTGATTSGTHAHTSSIQPSNIASGVLRGIWGVEPVYGSSAWGSLPFSYTVKRGDGGNGASTLVSNPYVTREYQVCLKCHSGYAYDTPPLLNSSQGTTPSGTNDVTRYTNQAMEFQAPAADKGESGGANHRSWHPVIGSTGRTITLRGASADDWLPPWNGSGGAYIGHETMYCSDCHGPSTANGTSTPASGTPWGPHGSINDFILKGTWNSATGTGQQSGICFKCHDYNQYANPNNTNPKPSGFRSSSGGGGMGMCRISYKSINLHIGHARKIGRLVCTWCHTAVPHGWKNKALLVDISQEGAGNVSYTKDPYYLKAKLGGGGPVNWKSSGNWDASDCGGRFWMASSCRNPP